MLVTDAFNSDSAACRHAQQQVFHEPQRVLRDERRCAAAMPDRSNNRSSGSLRNGTMAGGIRSSAPTGICRISRMAVR